MAEPLDIAFSALELIKKDEVEAWITVSEQRSVETRIRNGELEQQQSSQSLALTLELWWQQRYALHRTTDLRADAIRSFFSDALALTQALEPDPDRFLPDPSRFKGRFEGDLQLEDPSFSALTPEKGLQRCLEMDASAHKQERVLSVASSLEDSIHRGAAVSTNGFNGRWSGTVATLSCDVTIRDEGDRRPEGSSYATVRFLGDLPAGSRIGEEALERALARIGAQKGAGGKTRLVVDPRASGKLVSALLNGTDARSVQQERSVWRKMLGQPLFPKWFTVSDEPLLPRGLGSRTFDGEGAAARPLSLLADGCLQNLYVDSFYGRKIGKSPTTPGPSNRVLAPGSRPLEKLLDGSGIYVTSWLGGNSDATTGNFSFGLRGHRFENGRIGEPVGEMNATGNLLSLFGNLEEVGNDPWIWSSLRCPTLVFSEVALSGAVAVPSAGSPG